MQLWNLKSLVLCNEISLEKIAPHFGINKKFKWDEPMVLSKNLLNGIISLGENKSVYIYHFGALVFVNIEYHEIQDTIAYLKRLDDNLKNNNPDNYLDEYKIEVDNNNTYSLSYDGLYLSEFKSYYLDTIALILAKSTSLRKIETETDKLLDSIEDIIVYLDAGKFNISDRKIAKTSAKVLRFKYNTISYLMLLDKPRAAWTNEELEDFYNEAVELFELKERYEKMSHKTEVLQDITDVFSSLSHEKRGTKLEIMVIVLILFELIISLVEFYFKFK